MKSRKHRRAGVPSNILFGRSTLICSALLIVGTSVASIDIQDTALVVIDLLLFDTVSILVSGFNVIWLAYLVFGTKGAGHYKLTVWSITDTLIGHLLFHTSISIWLWKAAAVNGVYTVFSHTGDVSAWYALYDSTIYAFHLFGGGGIIDNVPVAEAARIISAIEMLWNAIVFLLMIAAAVATLQMHTDAPLTGEK